MTISELAAHLTSLSINHVKVYVGGSYVVTLGQTNNTCSHTVSASDLLLENAIGQALAIWERVNTPPKETP